MPSVFTGAGGLSARRPKVIEAGAWEVQSRPARSDAIGVGQRVFHQKFGYGRVTAVEDDKLDIEFDKAGTRRVLDRFVEKA
jgi:DNA helicase-2/ATP-dependent DNA helicase PcrA